MAEYFLAFTDKRYKKFQVNTFLTAKAIEYVYDIGLSVWNWQGSRNKGVNEYKRKWELVHQDSIYYEYNDIYEELIECMIAKEEDSVKK